MLYHMSGMILGGLQSELRRLDLQWPMDAEGFVAKDGPAQWACAQLAALRRGRAKISTEV